MKALIIPITVLTVCFAFASCGKEDASTGGSAAQKEFLQARALRA